MKNTKLTQKYDLLYIHPSSTPLGGFNMDDIIPMGIFSLMNSVNCSKIGKMYYEVNDEIIKNVKIIAMDLHWYFSLYHIEQLARNFKKINPKIYIIIGGYTATIFAEILVKKFDVDFVIRGDAEYSFPMLIDNLLNNKKNIKDIPNLVSKNFVSPNFYTLNQVDYDKLEFTECSWFETYKRNIYLYQRNKYDTAISPLISVFKGCKYNCEHCYGNPILHQKLCGRGVVSRSPESVIKELLYYSNDKNIKIVHILCDFIDILGEDYAKEIFSQKYNLNLYYEFFNLPKISILEKIFSSFNYCFFAFSTDLNHAEGKIMQNFEYLNTLLQYLKNKNCRIKIHIDDSLGFKFEGYFDEILKLWKRHYVDLSNNKFWKISIPYPKENKEEIKAEFNKFYEITKRKIIPSEFLKQKFFPIIYKSSFMTFLTRKIQTVIILINIIFKNLFTNSIRQPM